MARLRIGLLLAGGKGTRLGGVDKGSIKLGRQRLAEMVADRLRCQVAAICVAGLQRPDWFHDIGAEAFVRDETRNNSPVGPAGGLAAGLNFAIGSYGERADVFTVPIDTPFFPIDLADRLEAQRGEATVAIARHDGRLQPTFGLWRADCAAAFRVHVALTGERALHRLASSVGAIAVDVAADYPGFLNLNTQADVEAARILVTERGPSSRSSPNDADG